MSKERRNPKRISRKEWKAAYRRAVFENARLVTINGDLRDRLNGARNTIERQAQIMEEQQQKIRELRADSPT